MEILVLSLIFACWISLVYVSSLLFEAVEKRLEKAKRTILENHRLKTGRKEQVR